MTKDQAMIYVLMKENGELKLEIGRLRNNSIIIPENATNGDMIKALFNEQIKSVEMPFMKCYGFINLKDGNIIRFWQEWWNKPYKKGGVTHE